ncbi:MAG: CDF family Co(II)/Ni(II) efflux transporter DmeF [Desulfatitalea sp.]|nr:CDF family Co(II)/Ni(II) efflux transporter DmeF [Desulfatitalea sp.]
MHRYSLHKWSHAHDFALHDPANERRVLLVVGLTLLTMVVEIAAGMAYGSMALLADGWHMGTHAAALGITAAAYYFARKHARNRRFTFGTGKISVLGGFTSAVVLAVVALLIAVESVRRLFHPQPIHFNEALVVAVIGLIVNLVSALLLSHPHHKDRTDHQNHSHEDASGGARDKAHHHHGHGHQDHNLRSAYLHVLADALTSVLAICGLTAGKYWDWVWLDAAIGIVGSVIIAKWALGLLRATGKILLDHDTDPQTAERIRGLIEADADNRIVDLHLWQVGANQLAAIVSLVTHNARPPDYYKALLSAVDDLAHITVEVFHCNTEPCLPLTTDGDRGTRG